MRVPSTGTNNLGRVVTFVADGLQNPGAQLAVRADIANYSYGGLDGRNWIVTVSGKADENIASPFWRATINFGTGGVLSSIQASAYQGFSLSLPSSYCEVIIDVDPTIPTNIVPAGTYVFNVTLHRGIPNGESEVRLRTQTTVGNGIVRIPPFAKRFTPVNVACFGAGVTATFVTSLSSYTGPQLLLTRDAGSNIYVPAGDLTLNWAPNADVYVFDWLLEL